MQGATTLHRETGMEELTLQVLQVSNMTVVCLSNLEKGTQGSGRNHETSVEMTRIVKGSDITIPGSWFSCMILT